VWYLIPDDTEMHGALMEFWNTQNAMEFDSTTKSSGRIEAIKLVAEIAKPHLSKKGTISIDLGCGTGLFAEVSGLRETLGVDFSPSLLALAKKRMNTVWEKDIFDLDLKDNSVDNIVSLFVMDDYPSEKKRAFFRQVFKFLKPGGRLFFTAYSPNDERMGRLREVIAAKALKTLKRLKLIKVYLEEDSFYKRIFQECGFMISTSEIISTQGLYKTESEVLMLKREFIMIVARKPL